MNEPAKSKLLDRDRLIAHFDRWRALMSATRPTDRPKAARALRTIYRLEGLGEPCFVFCRNPFELAVMPKLLTKVLATSHWLAISKSLGSLQLSEDERLDLWNTHWTGLLSETIAPELRQLVRKPMADDEAYLPLVNPMLEQLQWLLQFHIDSPIRAFTQIEDPNFRYQDNSPVSFFTPLLEELTALFQYHFDPRTESTRSQPLPTYESLTDSSAGQRILYNFQESVMSRWNACVPPTEQAIATPGNLQPVSGVLGRLVDRWEAVQQEVGELYRNYRNVMRRFGDNLNHQLQNAMWMPFDLAWLMMYLTYDEASDVSIYYGIGGKAAEASDTAKQAVRAWLDLMTSCGAVICTPAFCFICDNPEVLSTSDGQLHNATGPALAYPGGFRQYSWNGTTIPSYVVEHPEQLTAAAITGERNSEVRRAMLEKFGISQYLIDSNAKVLHEDECGRLYRLDFPREAIVLVRVKNSTPEPDGTYKEYFLRVPPNMWRARQAVAWTFGMTEDQYRPVFES